VNAPLHIRIERRGNSFIAYAGKSGEPWTATAPQEVNLPGNVYVGLGVCSHDAGVLETAIFSNVQLNQEGHPIVSNPPPHPPASHFRSKITIYDLATRSTRVVYQADQVIEAPNWSRDGKFLLINTEGNLYRLPLQGSGEPKPSRSISVRAATCATTITTCPATVIGWRFPRPARPRTSRRSTWPKPLAPACA